MKLTTINNIHFNFLIVGKETPQEDWLHVKISYQGNGLKHSYTDPAIMTDELKDLIDWLERILINHNTQRRFTPIDQMIDFRFFGYKEGLVKIQIQLHYQYNNSGDALKLNFLLNKQEVIDWITELKRSYNYYSPSLLE
jgi:FAD/FMN-containing dehydrogenase